MVVDVLEHHKINVMFVKCKSNAFLAQRENLIDEDVYQKITET